MVKLSFSKISTYIDCPRKYFLSYICNMGTGSSVYMSNGSIIHRCCELFPDWPEEEQTMENLKNMYYKLMPEIDTNNLIHESITNITEDGEIITDIVINPVFEHKAIMSLQSFYDDYMENTFSENKKLCGPNRGDKITPEIVLQEQWFNIKTKDGHEVRGLIDRVDDEVGGEHIVDYKSGQSRTTFKALQDPLDIKSMQLSIYSLARYKETGKIPVKTSFFYLEPKKGNKVLKGEYRSAPKRSEEDLEKLETFLNDIGNEIQDSLDKKDFPIGASPNCFWCDFKDRCDILAESEIEKRKAMEIDNDYDLD